MKKLAILLAVLLLLSGCSPKGPEVGHLQTREANAHLHIWGKDREEAVSALQTLLLELDDRWAANYINSIPSQMNDEGTVLYLEDMDFLDQLEALSQRTAGAFDPMLHSVLSLWGFVDGKYQVPTQEALDAAMAEEKWNVSAATQGYFGRRAVQLLQTMRVERAILYIGACVQTYGENEDGYPWKIDVKDANGGVPIGQVDVYGTMMVASTVDRHMDFEENGKHYHGILDPQTGMPAESGLRSVTVISKDGVVADALTTALFVMGLEKATELWRQSNDFEAVFVLTDGSVYATDGANFGGGAFTAIHRAG